MITRRLLSVAPMMDWTDRHFRYLVRLISRHVVLYTEMISTDALLHGDRDRLLKYDPAEQPLAIQLGGSDPRALARCANMAEARGFQEVNLNVGCPSNRVQQGRFGACLMAEPGLVAACVEAMGEGTRLPVTVKTRIGIDDQDSFEALAEFIERVSAAGCTTFIIHARKAWLNGLSPKENRSKPPLRHDVVWRVKREFPRLEIVLNGGVENLAQAQYHLTRVDGVMIGRAAYHNPYLLAEADRLLFGSEEPARSRHEVIAAMTPYLQRMLETEGLQLHAITRHVLGLFHAVPGGRAFRRHLSASSGKRRLGAEILAEAARLCRS